MDGFRRGHREVSGEPNCAPWAVFSFAGNTLRFVERDFPFVELGDGATQVEGAQFHIDVLDDQQENVAFAPDWNTAPSSVPNRSIAGLPRFAIFASHSLYPKEAHFASV